MFALANKATILMAKAAATASMNQAKAGRMGALEKHQMRTLSALIGKLTEVHSTLCNPQSGQEDIMIQRLPRLLKQLEAVCTWKLVSLSNDLDPGCGKCPFPVLQGMVHESSDELRRTTPELPGVIMAFASSGGEKVGRFLSNLETFMTTRGTERSPQHQHISSEEVRTDLLKSPVEYHEDVNLRLHAALSQEFDCTCSSRIGCPCAHTREHRARLRLEAEARLISGEVLFDTLFSTAPACQCSHETTWQQLRFQVSNHTEQSRHVRFVENNLSLRNHETGAEVEQSQVIRRGNICNLLETPSGDVCIRLKIIDGCIHQLFDAGETNQRLVPAQSISLSEVLERHRVSSKEKILLAYTLAKSVWQYYDSNFTNMRWNTESIHFMRERRWDNENDIDREGFNPTRPCLAFWPSRLTQECITEFCEGFSVFHRYPRILALGAMLIDICRKRATAPASETRPLEEQLNSDFAKFSEISRSRHWPDLDIRHEDAVQRYKSAVMRCLDPNLFHISSSTQSQEKSAAKRRRDVLYTYVVLPLETLCADLGIIDNRPDALCLECPVPRVEAPYTPNPSFRITSGSLVPPNETCRQEFPNLQDYTIGWICAITTEYVAACELLDKKYEHPQQDTIHDDNAYTFGRIGVHNVVIAVLPKGRYGTTSAAIVARDMRRSFPSIRFGLMVGIGGGAPSEKHDIRLGDVVVSSPDSRNGGVIQYDFGKTIQTREFEQTGPVNAPPLLLLSHLQKIETQHQRRGHKIAAMAAEVIIKNPRLKAKYQRPDPAEDRLYRTSFVHVCNNKSCKDACQERESDLVNRQRRPADADDPAIHYGLIASSNRLIKDAVFRDAMSEKEGILCFEMEAAGLVNSFPCLIIRGICDYCDTHKNDVWQGYAALTAAIYAKELLKIIP